MAGRSLETRKQGVPPAPPSPPALPEPAHAVIELSEIQQTAARLYGQGYKRAQIQAILLDHLAPVKRPGQRDRTKEEQQHHARHKLRRWERSQKFRDLIWQSSIIELDLQSPEIISGVGRKAKMGRVDAARLAFELTGRHNPKGQDHPTEINVNIANVPRP